MKKLYTIFFISAFLFNITLANATDAYYIVGDQPIKSVQFYPNPAISSINFELVNASDINYTLTIYNFIGKRIEEVKVNTNKININLDGYYSGLYVFQLRNKAGQIVQSGKFQVSKS